MSYYNDIALDKAIKEAEREYDWDISYEQRGEEEIGRSTLDHYRVYIDGQYAQDEAEDFFRDFDFYSVSVYTTDYSYCELEIEIKS